MTTRWKQYALITGLAALPITGFVIMNSVFPDQASVSGLVNEVSGKSQVSNPPTGSVPLITWATEVALTPTPSPEPSPVPTEVPTTPPPVQAPQPAAPQSAPKVAAARTPTTAKPKAPAPTKVPAPIQATAAAAKPAAQQPATCSGGYNEQFICLLNQYRASKGKGRVVASGALNSVAVTHSKWMQSTGTFSHTGQDGSRFFERCTAGGTTCRAENLASGAGSAQNLLTMWKNSAGHNVNLLGPYTVIGLGSAGGYTTALFN